MGIPITLIALEFNTSVHLVERHLADSITVDDARIRCVEVSESSAYIAAARASCEAARDREARRLAEQPPNELRERVARLNARPSPADAHAPALAQMLANDENGAMARSSAAMDDMLRGHAVYHRLTDPEDGIESLLFRSCERSFQKIALIRRNPWIFQ
jgi:hypothetical protein